MDASDAALNADYAKICRDVTLEFAVKGVISLEGASVAGDLILSSKRIDKVSPAPATGAILRLQRADIRGALDLHELPKDAKTEVDLSDASCNVLKKNIPRRPQLKQRLTQLTRKLQQKFERKPDPELMQKLKLEGFVYRRIESQGDPRAQLNWLREQLRAAKKERRGEYRPQPYRQFANSLRAHGHDADARKCLISMAKDRRKSADLSWPSRAWQRILWCTIRNGHEPLRALYFLLGLWVIGFLAFGWGYQKHVLAPSDHYAYDDLTHDKALPGQYVPFCAPIYAIDTGLPIISLGERDRWYPRAVLTKIPKTEAHSPLYGNVCEASFTRRWDPDGKWIDASTLATLLAVGRWVYVVLGWFFASMLVAGISGLVGRE
jgi:hypothetical protein